MITTILVKNRIELQHHWPEAPEEVSYLQWPHRHQFYIESEITVGHDDRELEFIMVQHAIDKFLQNTQFDLRVSCEQLARMVGQFIRSHYGMREISVTVREDDEHGARVYLPKYEEE